MYINPKYICAYKGNTNVHYFKTVFSRDSVKPIFFVSFDGIISYISLNSFSEIHQVLLSILKLSLTTKNKWYITDHVSNFLALTYSV